MDKQLSFESSGTPSKSGVYMVDRGEKQGKAFRFYNAETDTWGRCEAELEDAYAAKDEKSNVGFFPWVGPLTGPKFKEKKDIDAETALVNVPVEVVAPVKPVKPVKAKKPVKPKKSTHADGDIVFREDRKKYVTFIGGKQVAARPTVEAIQKYLKKNHNIDGRVVK